MIEQKNSAGFKEESLVLTVGTFFIYDLNLEPWELSSIVQHLNTDGTNWSVDDFKVDGYKNYDEEYGSYYVGLLKVNTDGRSHQDFIELARIWEEAELICEKYLD